MLSYKGRFQAPRKKHRTPARKQILWSSYQQNIFNDAANGNSSTIILASPGSGKSTTILESLYHIPQEFRTNQRTLYVAFNSSIAAYLDEHVPNGVAAMTFHKLGFQTVRDNLKNIGGKSIDTKGELAQQLATEEVGSAPETEALRENLAMTMDLAKATLCENSNDIENVMAEHGIQTRGLDENCFAYHVHSMMEKTKEPRKLNGRHCISFGDMLWLPHVHGWQPKKYDRVFVDEAQDLSASRTELILKAMNPNARLCACGDKSQAIFSWCGATSDIIDKLQKTLHANVLPLSVSYRCPKNMVRLAQAINPNIEAAKDAIEGTIESIPVSQLYSSLVPGSAILSRTNYPLVTAALALARRGIKANIQGKDIGQRFLWRISTWKPNDVSHLVRLVNEWKSTISAILIAKGRPTGRIEDEAESILRFTVDAKSVQEVQFRIGKFFSDSPATIKLSSTHKAKGLEWNDVYLLEKTYHPGRSEEDNNIWYVAITRSRSRLVFVNGNLP